LNIYTANINKFCHILLILAKIFRTRGYRGAIFFVFFAANFIRMKITDIFLTAILILGLTACTENESPKNTHCCGFRKRTPRREDGESRSEMLPQPYQQPVHRQKMSLLTCEGHK